MGENYQSNLFTFISTIQKDLKDNKIDEKQFSFLLGLFLKKEINNIVIKEIDDIMPESNIKNNMTFLTYKRSRKFNHAQR